MGRKRRGKLERLDTDDEQNVSSSEESSEEKSDNEEMMLDASFENRNNSSNRKEKSGKTNFSQLNSNDKFLITRSKKTVFKKRGNIARKENETRSST